ncbi:MAG: efflux RND transporter periplasmic adaptor subunit [Myxococcales bacterium]|nr:efflux RND transporter periplasmic adaptor subunit [Myxococcales bacterium]
MIPVRYSRPAAWLRALCVAALALSSARCGADDPGAAELAPRSNVPVFEYGMIRFTPEFADKVGLRTEAAGITEIIPVVHVTGVLEYDEQQIAAVGSAIDGRITEVLVVEGTPVVEDTALAILQSAEVGSVQAELRAIEARSRVARANRKRKQALVREGIASKRSAEIAASEVSVIDAELRAARQRIQALGGSARSGEIGIIALRSPIAGEVAEVNVYRGQAVGPLHTAFTIVDYSRLWVRLAVFEGELQFIHKDDPVELTALTLPDENITGVVDYVSPSFDPQLRSAEVRVVVPNNDGLLRVGQAVTAQIHAESSRKETLTIPRSAVVMVDGQPTVFVQPEANAVVPRTVLLGVTGEQRVEIVNGLTSGEVVVTHGVFAIKSELFR